MYITPHNHALMIRYNSAKQLKIESFETPFELKLPQNNRWVRLSQLIPWDEWIAVYTRSLHATHGAPGIDARVAVGSLFIKHKLNLSDEETLKTIQENVYMQYFLGLSAYHCAPLFSSSLFPTLRKRMGLKEWDALNRMIIRQAGGKQVREVLDEESSVKLPANKGKLQIDATVADQYIKYPTDLDLLNQCREWSENIIDELYLKGDWDKKPRTYRRIARKDFLNLAKKKKKQKKVIRAGIRKQLNYLHRNFGYIYKMLDSFPKGIPIRRQSYRYLLVIKEICRQQKQMYDQKTNSAILRNDRIVSLHQPHVRPIVRGKARNQVEFGSKISLSLTGGYSRIDRLSWDNFNESGDLIGQVEAYKEIQGYWPELVQCDGIYPTRENRKWLKERNIRITAKPLGRKPKEDTQTPYQKRKKKKEAAERNRIEGKFGQAKNGYHLNKVRAKLKETSESWVGAIFWVTNVVQLFRQTLG